MRLALDIAEDVHFQQVVMSSASISISQMKSDSAKRGKEALKLERGIRLHHQIQLVQGLLTVRLALEIKLDVRCKQVMCLI